MNKYSDLDRKNDHWRSNKAITLIYDDKPIFTDQSRPIYSKSIFSLSPDPLKSVTERSLDFKYTPGISPISYFQNTKLKEATQISKSINDIKVIKLPAIDIKSPTNKDFNDLLAKIDSVVSPRHKPKITTMKEEDAIHNIQQQKTTNYYKVSTKGKRCPLCCKLKINSGKIIIYFSFTQILPGPQDYDRIFYNTSFEISDNVFEFKAEHAFFGFYCEVETSYKFEICFGKILSAEEIKNKKKKNILEEYEKILQRDRSEDKNKPYEKDFIRNNKEIKMQNSAIKAQDNQIKAEEWQRKRERVMTKKNEIFKEKKVKAIESLNRKNRRLEREATLKDEYEKAQEIIKGYQD